MFKDDSQTDGRLTPSGAESSSDPSDKVVYNMWKRFLKMHKAKNIHFFFIYISFHIILFFIFIIKFQQIGNLYIMGGGRRVSWSWSYGSWIYYYLCNQCLSPLMLWVRVSIRARCTTLCLSVTCDRSVIFSGSSTNKTDRHDIAEILLKLALNIIKQAKIYIQVSYQNH
jgi:hypothetical protein